MKKRDVVVAFAIITAILFIACIGWISHVQKISGHQAEGCIDTCESFGFECGSWTICNEEVNCGDCPGGTDCEAGLCLSGAEASEAGVGEAEGTQGNSMALWLWIFIAVVAVIILIVLVILIILLAKKRKEEIPGI